MIPATTPHKQRPVVPELRSIPLTFMECEYFGGLTNCWYDDDGEEGPCSCAVRRQVEECPENFP